MAPEVVSGARREEGVRGSAVLPPAVATGGLPWRPLAGRDRALGGIGETPARARRRRTRRGAASSVGRIALLFGLPASSPRLVRRSPVAHAGFTNPSYEHRARRQAGARG